MKPREPRHVISPGGPAPRQPDSAVCPLVRGPHKRGDVSRAWERTLAADTNQRIASPSCETRLILAAGPGCRERCPQLVQYHSSSPSSCGLAHGCYGHRGSRGVGRNLPNPAYMIPCQLVAFPPGLPHSALDSSVTTRFSRLQSIPHEPGATNQPGSNVVYSPWVWL